MRDNVTENKKSYYFYTDGSLKQIDNNIMMAIGWIQVESIDSKKIIAEFFAANIEWPSSMKAEIIAILSVLLVVTSNSNVVIYTDSQNAINQYNCYKSELSFKRKLKITGYLIWEIIIYLTTKYNINLRLIKIKSHVGNWGNDSANALVKKGLSEPRLQVIDKLIEDKAIMQWYNRTVEWRPRKFIKTLKTQPIDVDKKLLYKILNTKSSDSITTYETFKEVKRKMFKFKLMINELPVIENLKRRTKICIKMI